jgi:acyl-CoA hydrolase
MRLRFASMKARTAEESKTQMTELVLPSDSNALGTAFGGRVMQWIDVCGAIAAQRHCQKAVVTASMDDLHFHAPIKMGMVACIEARVTATFRRSLEVSVVVYSEEPTTATRRHCCSARLTFTAIDDAFRPTEVPPLLLTSAEGRAEQAAAEQRREERLLHKQQSNRP